ncbi:MAG: sigma factor [Pirellulaceae bacterium]
MANNPDVTDHFTTQFIRKTAKTLIADGFFPRGDLDDLIQDLTLAVIEGLSRNYDPQRAKWTTFVKTVVQNRAVSLCRARTAECRDMPVGSLSAPVEDEDGHMAPLGNLVREDETFDRIFVEARDDEECRDLAIDVEAAVAALPRKLQAICRKLEHRSVAQTVRDLRLPRTTVASRMAGVRDHFAEAGLDEYVAPSAAEGVSA